MSTPQVGEVFGYVSGKALVFWKITKIFKPVDRSEYSCMVIRCSKTGKEFSQSNSFRISFVEKQERWMGVKEKASTSGKQAGIDKRRIAHLESEIKRYSEELEQLKAKYKD